MQKLLMDAATGEIVNVIVASEDYEAPQGQELIEGAPEGCGIGWRRDSSGGWHAPVGGGEPPTAEDVRAEASRRMCRLVGARDADHLAIMIANASREATRLQALRIGIPGLIEARTWTAAEAERAASLFAIDAAIEAIRAASNAMEGAPPTDYADDARWPA